MAAAIVAIATMQVAFTVASTTQQCTKCVGANTPQAGQQAESCNGTGQLGVVGEANPSGHVYKPQSLGTDHIECSKPTPGGSVPCTNLRTGCCPSGDAGFFMCNIVVQQDCSFISQCASVCCPAGNARAETMAQPGCSMSSIFLVCNAASNNAP